MICSAFSGILKGVYHERIEYPKVQPFTIKDEITSSSSDDEPHENRQIAQHPSEADPAVTADPEPGAEKGEADSAD